MADDDIGGGREINMFVNAYNILFSWLVVRFICWALSGILLARGSVWRTSWVTEHRFWEREPGRCDLSVIQEVWPWKSLKSCRLSLRSQPGKEIEGTYGYAWLCLAFSLCHSVYGKATSRNLFDCPEGIGIFLTMYFLVCPFRNFSTQFLWFLVLTLLDS